MEPNIVTPAPQVPATPRKRILIIEDENFIGDLYERALQAGGYEPNVVIDGALALKEAQTNQYDVILLDIMLPNMTGTEILATLRNTELTPNLKAKIIITTNLELDDEGRAAIENKADGYIVKADITPKELVSFLDQIDFS
jgi:DNA-binding response OmpR family regulator